jgi:hypothetical protein
MINEGLLGFCFGIVAGIIFGIGIHHTSHKETPKKEVKIEELEKIIDRSTCEAIAINAIINERMRLTGKPNP